MEKPNVVQENIPLQSLNTWKVGGNAQYFVSPNNLEELKIAYQWAMQNKIPVSVLSTGSNVLISDSGIEGLVVHMPSLRGLEVAETETLVNLTAWAGTPKSEVMREFLKRKLPPALFLTGLPGDIGGGVAMNAGVGEARFPREFCEIVSWIKVLKFENDQCIEKFIRSSELKWSYRHCTGWQPGIITQVGLQWEKTEDPDIMKKIKEATKNRLTKQPLELPSCGSTFVNPEGHKAGALIEQSGLKGFTLGGAQVSTKHANFIVNINNATAQDIYNLIEHIKKTVKLKTKVQLTTEIIYLGRW